MTEPRTRNRFISKGSQWPPRSLRGRLPNATSIGRFFTNDSAFRWAAPAALGAIAGLDLIASSRDWHLAVIGVLDEPAHLLTAGLVLALLPTSFATRVGAWALAASVAIDLDHLPLYTFAPGFATEGGRPPTHSFGTILVFLVAAALVPKWRAAFFGIATGVGLHFLRDIATGPGLSLGWPIAPENLRVPYFAYFGVLVVVTGLIEVTSRRSTRLRRTPADRSA